MRTARDDRIEVEIDLPVELRGFLDRFDQTDLVRASRIEADAGREERGRVSETDLAHDVRRHDRRQDAETHLGEREHRLGRGDRDVRDRDEPAATADRRSLHPREQRHRELVQPAEHLRQRAGVGDVLREAEIGHAAHPVEVRAGAEGVALAAKDDGARSGIDAAEEVAQLRDEVRVERVAHVRARERDPGDPTVIDLEPDNVGHGGTIARTSAGRVLAGGSGALGLGRRVRRAAILLELHVRVAVDAHFMLRSERARGE